MLGSWSFSCAVASVGGFGLIRAFLTGSIRHKLALEVWGELISSRSKRMLSIKARAWLKSMF